MLVVNLAIIINVHFTVCSFHSLIATNYSDFFLPRTQKKKYTLANHVVYCFSVLSSKLTGIKVFGFSPYFCIKNFSCKSERQTDYSLGLNTKFDTYILIFQFSCHPLDLLSYPIKFQTFQLCKKLFSQIYLFFRD